MYPPKYPMAIIDVSPKVPYDPYSLKIHWKFILHFHLGKNDISQVAKPLEKLPIFQSPGGSE